MKNIVSILSFIAILICSNALTAQTVKSSQKSVTPPVTETLKVSGVCGMCKKRIEKAVFGVKGIESASWNVKDQLLTVTFDSKKTTKEAIAKHIAAAGHDVEMVKAADKSYSKLPDCCRYRDGAKCEH
jgi:periplasmic mercuric ion binding protein